MHFLELLLGLECLFVPLHLLGFQFLSYECCSHEEIRRDTRIREVSCDEFGLSWNYHYRHRTLNKCLTISTMVSGEDRYWCVVYENM